jgi:PAS domain S-box-containing protein
VRRRVRGEVVPAAVAAEDGAAPDVVTGFPAGWTGAGGAAWAAAIADVPHSAATTGSATSWKNRRAISAVAGLAVTIVLVILPTNAPALRNGGRDADDWNHGVPVNHYFKDLVDVPRLQELTDELYIATGIPSAIITMDGEILTGSGWQRICTRFHRMNPVIEQECIASDRAIRKGLDAGEPYVMYRCPRGLVDASAPVIIEGEHVANVFAGQLFTEPPDEGTERFFREQARHFGLDEEAYLAAFREVPVYPEAKLRPALSFLADFASVVASIGLAHKRELEALLALRETEVKYHDIFENAVEGIFRTGVDGRIIEANPAMARAHGYASVAAMMAAVRNIGDVYVHPAQRQEFSDRLRNDGVVTGFEIESLRQDGSHVWLSVAARAVHDPDGRLQYYEGTIEDITARRLSEDRVRQAQKMEALGTLAGGIAHDFNNILHAIVANVELLRMELDEDSVAQEMVGEIRTATRRATDLVRQILAFSRQQDQLRQPILLSPVLKEVGKLLRAALPASIAITTDIGAELPHVLADASQIHQVLMNLATNAGHAMHARGGTLTLALRREWVTPERAALLQGLRDGPYVRLAVSDTGEGMDPATVDRIFEPFFTTKGPGEGTGLGLSVVHGIVSSHDGAIAVASCRGAGTTFDIYLPAIETTPTIQPDQPDTLPRGHGERIAVVDDEPAVLRSAVRVLLQLGYTATGFAYPQDALATLGGNPDACDAVITDLTMPGMTGLEVARRLREAGLMVPIVLTTGYSATLTEESARAQGISAVLAKPFSAEGVARVLRRVLQRDE